MVVTSAKFYQFNKGRGSFIGYGQVTLDNQLVVTGLSVFKKEGKISVAFPARKKGDEWFDIVICLDAELRAEITSAIREKVSGEKDSEDYKDPLPF